MLSKRSGPETVYVPKYEMLMGAWIINENSVADLNTVCTLSFRSTAPQGLGCGFLNDHADGIFLWFDPSVPQ